MSEKAKKLTAQTLKLTLLGLAVLGLYTCHEKKEFLKAEAHREVLADRQAREAKKRADPNYTPTGLNRRHSNALLQKVIAGIDCGDERGAPLSGHNAGFAYTDLGNTLIHDEKPTREPQKTPPKTIPNRYKDSAGR